MVITVCDLCNKRIYPNDYYIKGKFQRKENWTTKQEFVLCSSCINNLKKVCKEKQCQEQN